MVRDDFTRLYARAHGGDADAVGLLVESYADDIARFLARHMGAHARRRLEADDIAQTIALTVVERIGGWPADLDRDEVKSYLLRIAKWRVADAVRQAKREPGESAFPTSDVADGPATGPVTRADEIARLRTVIDGLPDRYAAVMRCCVLEGLGTAAAAERLGLSPEAVRQRLVRARRMVAEDV